MPGSDAERVGRDRLSHPVGTLVAMENQLHLRITTPDERSRVSTDASTDASARTSTDAADWHLDDASRASARSGIALARAALEAARRARHTASARVEQPSEARTEAA